jgi:hypothetical protein
MPSTRFLCGSLNRRYPNLLSKFSKLSANVRGATIFIVNIVKQVIPLRIKAVECCGVLEHNFAPKRQ